MTYGQGWATDWQNARHEANAVAYAAGFVISTGLLPVSGFVARNVGHHAEMKKAGITPPSAAW